MCEYFSADIWVPSYMLACAVEKLCSVVIV